MAYTNEALFQGKLPVDHLCVVTRKPAPGSAAWVVDIDLAASAAVHSKHAGNYRQPYTVDDVRENEGGAKGKDLWLLSGGTIVRDHRGRFAVGLRDGNAADAFKFTNIGAGRCDRRLEDHCHEELVSEFVLCVKEGRKWVQVQFFPRQVPPLLREVRLKRQTIERWKADEGAVPRAGLMPLSHTRIETIASPEFEPTSLQVNWTRDGEIAHKECLGGYLLLDRRNRTLEFRLPFALDLQAYEQDEVEIFFAEGTGYAAWKSEDELRRLAALSMVTPLLEAMLL